MLIYAAKPDDFKPRWFWAWVKTGLCFSFNTPCVIPGQFTSLLRLQSPYLFTVHNKTQPQKSLEWNVIMHNVWNMVNMLELFGFFFFCKQGSVLCSKHKVLHTGSGRAGRGWERRAERQPCNPVPLPALRPIHFKQPKDTAVTWWTWRVLCQVKYVRQRKKHTAGYHLYVEFRR